MTRSIGSSNSQSWEKIAIDLQQNLMYHFGVSDWDCYEFSERDKLESKVGYALYGPPQNLPSPFGDNKSGYEQKQWENIKGICELVIQEDIHEWKTYRGTWMALIFVCVPAQNIDVDKLNVMTIPIFKVPKYYKNQPERVAYIDSNARVYASWDDFLENNLLPACRYCYPKRGVYTPDKEGNVLVEFGESPACSPKQQAFDVLDKTSTIMGIGTTIIALTSLAIPIAGPVLAGSIMMGGAVGTYGAYRSTTTLIDRAKHKQSISLENAEARNCWISLAGSVVGTASSRAMNSVRTMATTGQTVSKTTQLTATALTVGSLAINGIGVINGGFMLHEKYKEDTLTPLDVFQFTSSVFFFTHSAVNMKTAGTIFKETQTDIIQKYQESLRSNRQRKAFNRLEKNTQRNMNEIEGKAKIIRSIRNINNKDDFFAGVVRMEKDFRKARSNVKFAETGHVEINEKITVDPLKLAEVRREQRRIILSASKDLSKGKLSRRQFNKVVKPILGRNHIPARAQADQTKLKISSILQTYSSTDNSSELHTICVINIMSSLHPDLHDHLLAIVQEVCEKMGMTVQKFFVTLSHVCNCVREVIQGYTAKIQELIIVARKIWERVASKTAKEFLGTLEGVCKYTCKILCYYHSTLHEPLLTVAIDLCARKGWKTAHEFLYILRQVCRFVSETAQNLKENFRNEDSSQFNEEGFDKNYDMKGRMHTIHCSKVLEQLHSDPTVKDTLIVCIMKAREGADNSDIVVSNEDETRSMTKEVVFIKRKATNIISSSNPGGDLTAHFQDVSLQEEVHSQASTSIMCEDTPFKPNSLNHYTKENPLVKSHKFCTNVKMTPNEMYEIVEEVLEIPISEENCMWENNELHINALVIDYSGTKTVVVKCNPELDTVVAYVVEE